jgi:uncharacterized membrane protein YcjF (UPF0283 family)
MVAALVAEQLTALALLRLVRESLRQLAMSPCGAVRLELAQQVLEQPVAQQI